MQLWVLQTNKLMDALKGAGGSVRALALYPGPEPCLASVGLDRFLRVHDASSKAGKARVYLKQQLSSVAWLPLRPQPPAATAAVGAEQAGEGAAEGAGGSSKRKKNQGSKSKSGSRQRETVDAGADEAAAALDADAAEQQQLQRHSKKRRKQQRGAEEST